MDADDIGRTRIQILYKDVLGEVTEVLNRVERLKTELPASAEEKLHKPVGQLIMLAQHIEKKVAEQTQKRLDAVNADISASGERAKNDALGDVRQAVREAVQQPVIDLVKDLNIAVNKAQGQQGETWKKAFIAALVGGIVGGGIVLTGTVFMFSKSQEQAAAAAAQADESPAAAAKQPKKGNK